MSKAKELAKKQTDRPKRPTRLVRYSNTLILILLTPLIFVCVLYIVVFHLLNSTMGPKILHGQLGSFLRGDYDCATMSTDALLQTLTMTHVTLREAGKKDDVIYAKRLEAKIPILELRELSNNTLFIGRIKAYDAQVNLDFTRGELNILKVVMPYPSKPEPPEPKPAKPSVPSGSQETSAGSTETTGTEPPESEFIVFLSNLNAEHTDVHLIFDGFRIDLFDSTVDNYGIRIGEELEMTSPPASEHGKPAIHVEKGLLTFTPALFSFPLSSVGDKSEGLVVSSGSGMSGNTGYAFRQAGRYIEDILRRDMAIHVGAEREMRGNYLIPLENLDVDGFYWYGNTFKIPDFTGIVGNGGFIHMTEAMMNVGPTQKEIDAHSAEHHHKPSGLIPEESILWAAKFDLNMRLTDNVLEYFFGPIFKGDSFFKLNADMAGDLARVSGDVTLDIPQFETFNVEVESVGLRAHMDGQHFEIKSLEADTVLGGMAAKGYYEIMDGNFNLDLYAGKEPLPGSYEYIDPQFAKRMGEGITPLDILPDGQIKRFSGIMSGHINVQSQDGTMSAYLPEKLVYKLDTPYAGIKKIELDHGMAEDKRIITLRDGIIESPGGLELVAGMDTIRIEPGLFFNLENPSELIVDVTAHIDAPTIYTEALGVEDFEIGPVELAANYHHCEEDSCGELKLKTRDIFYMGVDIPDVDIDLQLNKSDLKTKRLYIETEFAKISGDIQAHIKPSYLDDPFMMPFKASIDIKDIDLENVHLDAVESLNLYQEGHGEGTLNIEGPLDKMFANMILTFTDVDVKGVPMSRVSIRARYEDNQIYVPGISVWFKKAEITEEEAARLDAQASQDTLTANAARGLTSGNKAKQNEQAQARRPYLRYRDGVLRRAADFSINTLTYDIKSNVVSLNTFLKPVSPNEFQIFKDLGLPVEGTVSFDLSANADINLIQQTLEMKTINLKKMQATWIEGFIKIQDLKYADLNLGNTEILMSRSQQYALIKGNIIDTFDLSGFIRTAPKLSVSVSLNFPHTDIIQTLDRIGIKTSDFISMMNITDANISGSIGFCMKSFDNMQISAILDDISIRTFNNELSLTQPAFIRADLNKQSITLRQIELKYKDSVLKLSGDANAKGNINLDMNGEIDAAIARSIIPKLRQSTGLLGVSMAVHGNIYDHNKQFSLNNLDVTGYLGVRDPIQIRLRGTRELFELRQGFFIFDKNSAKCPRKELCVYTLEDQPFMFGVNNEWINLSIFASALGDVRLNLSGKVNATLAQMFVSDISDAKGQLALNIDAEGKLFNPKNFGLTLEKMNYNATLSVEKPISVQMRTLNEPVSLNSGIIRVANGNECPDKTQCIVIPKNNPIQGELMGGNYVIFGDVTRRGIVPKKGKLSITASNIGFRMKDELALTLSPDIQITAKDLSDFDTITVSGDVDILEATYRKNFGDGTSNFIKEQILSLFIDSRRRVETYSPSFLRKMPQLGKIHLDVGASAENTISAKVQIAGTSIDLDVGAQLRIGGTIKDFYPTGIVSISSGVFSLRNNDFEFQNGAQISFNGSLDGKINITATTEINTASDAFSSVTSNTDLDRRKRISTSSTSSTDLYSITLTVSGSVFKPVWSFESNPYLTDTNIYALVLTGHTIEDFSGNDIAMETLLSPFSSKIDTFLKADQFKFVFNEGAAQFVYAKQISERLRIAAGVSIRGTSGNEQALSGEYYFNDNWFFDLTGQNTSDEKGRAPTFKLGGKLHWHLLLK